MKIKKITSFILAMILTVSLGFAHVIGHTNTVLASEKSTFVHKNIMSIKQSQQGGILNPTYTESLTDDWQGDYIYYGIDDDGAAIKWKLLSRSNSNYGNSNAFLLWSDKTFGKSMYYHDSDDHENKYIYDKSDLKVNMQNTMFNKFSDLENEVVHISSNSSTVADRGAYESVVFVTTPMENNKWFPLSARELTQKSFGFSSVPFTQELGFVSLLTADASRASSDGQDYWMRSYRDNEQPPYNWGRYTNTLGSGNGAMNYTDFSTHENAMRPAMNLDTTKISLVKDSTNRINNSLSSVIDSSSNEFKLALFDDSQSLTISNVKKTGNEFEFNYLSTGNAKYLSVIIEDKNGAVQFYGNIENNLDVTKNGSSKINLNAIGLTSDDVASGNYTLSFFTEIINGDKLTDYTSAFIPLELKETPPEIINHVPTINATDKVLTVGDAFHSLEGVTAQDDEDGDITLTDANITSNNVDTSKTGTYHVTYTVTDSQGASTTKTISVIVNPKMEGLNHVPTINATDKVLTVGDAFHSLEGATAQDDEDGDITLTDANITSNNVDTSKTGTYHVTYTVTDSQGASATKTISITVKEKESDNPVTPENPSKPETPSEPISSESSSTDTSDTSVAITPNSSNSSNSNVPQTSDNNQMFLLLGLILVFGSLSTVLIAKHTKKDS